MRKFIKFVLILLVLILLFLFFGGKLLDSWMDPNKYRDTINEKLSEMIGRPTQILGEMKWQLFPRLYLEARSIEVDNVDGDPKPFLSAEKMELSVRIQPLIKQKIDLHELVIDHLVVRLNVDVQGENNWHDLATSESSNVEATSAGKPSNLSFDIDNLKIRNASIVYENHLDKQHSAITELTIESYGLTANESAPLDISFNFMSKKSGQTELEGQNIHLEGEITLPKLQTNTKQPFPWQSTFNGELSVKRMTTPSLVIDNLQSEVKMNPELFALEDLEATMFDGRLSGKVTLHYQHPFYQLTLDQQLKNMNAGEFFQHRLKKSTIKGKTNFNSQLSASHRQLANLHKDLSGNAQFEVREGSIQGINLLRTLFQVIRLTEKTEKMPDTHTNETPFSELSGTFQIKQGVVSNNDLKLVSPLVDATGKGSLDLNKETVHYNLLINLSKSDLGDKVNRFMEKFEKGVPIKISGNFDHYSAKPDMIIIAKTLGLDFLNTIGKEATHLGKETGKSTKKLFNKAVDALSNDSD